MTLAEEVEIIVDYLFANDIIRREYYTRANDNINLNAASAV